MTSRTIVLFVNPRAGTGGGRKLVQDLRDLLLQHGLDVELIDEIPALKHFVEHHRDQIRAIVAAGGDGTVETVVNAAPGDVPIAILPLGTENLLAKYLKIDAHPRRLVEMISLGRTVRFDAGRANGKLFLVMLSCGFDADVVRRVHAEREGNITHLAYAKPILDSIRSYDYPELKASWETDAGVQEICCNWAFLFNAPIYAAGLQIVGDGDPTDGAFELATFRGGSFWQGLRQFGAVVFGQHHELTDFDLNRCTGPIRISSRQDNVAYQVDVPSCTGTQTGRLTI